MLQLASATESGWASRALGHLDEILLEQAHLEKKAAAAALRYLFRYPDRAALQLPLSALAREELQHFELVLSHLRRRRVDFGPQVPSVYAAELQRAVRAQEPQRLLDSLLCSALIEARSCERMRLLGEVVGQRDAKLGALYAELVASEARHHGLYLRLAEGEFGTVAVRIRLAELAAHEATVLASLPELPRLHT